MPEKTVLEQLQNSFPPSSKAAWVSAAEAELGGKNPAIEKLWSTPDGLTFHPFYDVTDAGSTTYLKSFQLPPASQSFRGAQFWFNMPRVTVTDAQSANIKALEHLALGADGIVFDVRKCSKVDFHSLLNDIQWPHCAVSFFFSDQVQLTQLAAYINEHYPVEKLDGAVFWETFPEKIDILTTSFLHGQKINFLGLLVESSTPVQEISNALREGVKYVDMWTDFHHADAEKVIRTISFSLGVGNNFLVEGAKLKALRMLWFQVVHAYGVKKYEPHDLYLHTRSETWINESYQPHGNMVKGTLAAMASVAGGCNALTVIAEEETNPMMNRVARNISSILREESHFDKVADPLAGSYAIENMVTHLAEAAWKKFIEEIAD
ncbi:MAG: hypothetical protein JNM57_03285 [Cyclobacteriaceae bacterium]|nr:hypothetical protein [Cyclobacteriaceae bacterium]